MKIIGCDLHAAKQTIAMLEPRHGGDRREDAEPATARRFVNSMRSLPAPAVGGIEATGSMGWFLGLMVEDLGLTLPRGSSSRVDPQGGDASAETSIDGMPISC